MTGLSKDTLRILCEYLKQRIKLKFLAALEMLKSHDWPQCVTFGFEKCI